jgi:hypothetical protein
MGRRTFSAIAATALLTLPTAAQAQARTKVPPAKQAQASKTEIRTKDYSFTYSYPAAAARIAPLRTWLERDRGEARATLIGYVAEGKSAQQAVGRPFQGYESIVEWSVATETPRLLSLSAKTYDYTGGAHGSPGFRALLWDKTGKRRLEPVAVFTSTAALNRAVASEFCRQIDAQRAKKREGLEKGANGMFDACPPISDTTVILGSTNRRTINRVGFLIGPYVAGPYSEGSYEVTVPVTPALLRAVKPQYRAAFSAR